MEYGLDEYDLLDDQPTAFARWVTPALIISILVHALALVWLARQHIPLYSDDQPNKVAVPTFKFVQVPPEPKVFQPRPADKKQAASAPQAVELPKDKPSLAAMAHPNPGAPAIPKIDNPMPAPKIKASSLAQTMLDAQNAGVKSVAGDLDQIRETLPTENPGGAGAPLIDFSNPNADASGSPAKQGALAGSDQPGFSDLDKLVAQTGPLADETAIRMDSDVLYEFDSSVLQPAAAGDLMKLGQIIQKNPQFDVSIEGHSDSFGSDEYDQTLSEQRAESVKTWLVQNMGIDPARIQTSGAGKSKLIVPATGEYSDEHVRAEQINRRVEIVLHDRKSATP